MAIVRQTVEKNGGRVELRSEAGSGTIFKIALPAHESGHDPVEVVA